MADREADRTTGPDQTETADQTTRWQRFIAHLPLGLALLAVGLVWFGGCVWSFEEQTAFAESNGFTTPELLPLVVDGMAIAMAAVAFAASLDARPAVFARLGTALAIACSSASNAAWAWERASQDFDTLALAAGVPVVSNLAFEVILGEIRRQVLRRRGEPAPVSVPFPRLVRLVLAPWATFWTWRRLVLEATDPRKAFAPDQTRPPIKVESTVEQTSISQTEQTSVEQTEPMTAVTGPVIEPVRRAVVERTATVTSIGPRQTEPRQSGPAAVRNAQTIKDRYGDVIPGQKTIENELGWGAERVRAALRALDQTG